MDRPMSMSSAPVVILCSIKRLLQVNVLGSHLENIQKSLKVGGHWPLWRGWRNRMTTQNRQKSNAKQSINKSIIINKYWEYRLTYCKTVVNEYADYSWANSFQKESVLNTLVNEQFVLRVSFQQYVVPVHRTVSFKFVSFHRCFHCVAIYACTICTYM